MPSLSHFLFLSKSIRYAIYLIMLFFIIHYFYRSYELYLYYQPFIVKIHDFQFIEKNIKIFLDILVQFSFLLAWLVFKIAVIFLCIVIFNKIPVPSKLIGHWFSQHQINPILGRIFIYHYRYNRICNIDEFIYFCHCADIEKYHIELHSNNPFLEPLFKTYDMDYNKDKLSK